MMVAAAVVVGAADEEMIYNWTSTQKWKNHVKILLS